MCIANKVVARFFMLQVALLMVPAGGLLGNDVERVLQVVASLHLFLSGSVGCQELRRPYCRP